MTFVLNFPDVTPNWVEVLTALAAPVAVLIAIATVCWQWIPLERQLKPGNGCLFHLLAGGCAVD